MPGIDRSVLGKEMEHFPRESFQATEGYHSASMGKTGFVKSLLGSSSDLVSLLSIPQTPSYEPHKSQLSQGSLQVAPLFSNTRGFFFNTTRGVGATSNSEGCWEEASLPEQALDCHENIGIKEVV